MKKNMVKKMMMVMATMTLLVPGFHVNAEEDIIMEVQTEEPAETEEDMEELIEDELILTTQAEEICTEVIIEPEAENHSVNATYTEDATFDVTFEEETETEAIETEAIETEEPQTEEAQTEEAESEEAESEEIENEETESEEVETEEVQTEESEASDENRTFSFENEEVVIKVVIGHEAEVPENLEMTAKKLEAGSEKYEAAKAATISSLGTSGEEDYAFYEVSFEKDGSAVEMPESQMTISVHFKNQLSAVQIKDGEAKNL